MIANIDETRSFAEKNSRLKTSTLKTYLSVLNSLLRFVKKNGCNLDESNLLIVLAKYEIDYLGGIKKDARKSSSVSALKFWRKTIIDMQIDKDEIRSCSDLHSGYVNDTFDFTGSEHSLLLEVTQSNSFNSKKKIMSKELHEIDSNFEDADMSQSIRILPQDDGAIDVEIPRRQMSVHQSSLSTYLRDIWDSLIDYKDPKNIFSGNNGWSEATIEFMSEQYRCFIYFLTLKKSTDNIPGGLGLNIDEVTVFDLINLEYVKLYIEFRIIMIGNFTQTPLFYFRFISAMVKPKYGWIRNNLNKIYKLHGNTQEVLTKISRKAQNYVADIEDSYISNGLSQDSKDYEKLQKEIQLSARTLALCDQAYEEAAEMHKGLKNKLQGRVSKDPFIPIDSLVKMDKPLKMVTLAIIKEQDRILEIMSGPPDLKDMKTIQRNLMATLMLINPLRSSHWKKMTYVDGKAGHLKRTSGGNYEIHNPTGEFKNGRSIEINRKTKLIKTPISNQKLDKLKKILTIYLERYLPLLAHSNTKNLLFPDLKGGYIVPGAEIRKWVVNVLLDVCKTYGVKGVRAFGCHAFRHLGAMGVLKRTKSMQAAADFLLDDLKTVMKHYLKYMPDDYLTALIEDNINDLF